MPARPRRRSPDDGRCDRPYQSAGMIAVQLGIRVDEALVRLRAHAFSHDHNLIDVAHDVIEHRLRFDDDDNGYAP